MQSNKPYEVTLLVMSAVLLSGFVGLNIWHAITAEQLQVASVIAPSGGPTDPHITATSSNTSIQYVLIILGGALFCFVSSLYLLRPRATLMLLAMCLVIGWIAEQIGAKTGLIFGDYYYTDVLGPKLGEVPFVIPFAWFMVGYLAYVNTNLIMFRKPAKKSNFQMIVWLSIITAFIGTAYDLVLDTLLSGTLQAWIWDPPGEYFGVPFHNYIGWWIVLFIISLLFRWFQRFNFERRIIKMTPWAALMPILAYAWLTVTYVIRGEPVETQLISIFALGIPTIISAWSWCEYKDSYKNQA